MAARTNVVAVVQARTASRRLPGKVLADVAGAPMLAQQLRRLRSSSRIDEIVVATTERPDDDGVARVAEVESVGVFRGDEDDVLARFVGAAQGADVVVRLTGDCPLTDAGIVDLVVEALTASGADYASNVEQRTFPRGLDVEALTMDALLRVHELAESDDAREHVTWLVRHERPELFRHVSIADAADNSDLRWTVDTEDDLAYVRLLFERLGLAAMPLPYEEILAAVRAAPELQRFDD